MSKTWEVLTCPFHVRCHLTYLLPRVAPNPKDEMCYNLLIPLFDPVAERGCCQRNEVHQWDKTGRQNH